MKSRNEGSPEIDVPGELRIRKATEDAEQLVTVIRSRGVPLEHLGDLRHRPLDFEEAFPILLELLPSIQNPQVKEAAINAFGGNWAPQDAARVILSVFRDADPSGLVRWRAADVISRIADDTLFDELRTVVLDPTFGPDRAPLTLALAKAGGPRALPVLLELLDDPGVFGMTIRALGEAKAPGALERLHALEKHPEAWVRREVQRAIKKIERASRAK